MEASEIKKGIVTGLKAKAKKTILDPLNTIADQNITDVVTTIGSFIARSVRGKFQRSITFTIGNRYSDRWMEEALYGILYKYNNIRAGSQLELSNKRGMNDGSGMYYRLDDGTHSMKYRGWDILVCIQTANPNATIGRVEPQRIYTIITYDMSPDFCSKFEQDMLAHRNSLLKIKADSPTVTIYKDYHESDGWTYWDKCLQIPKRKLNTVYLPMEQKRKIVDTVNEFFANREYYRSHGISHNLKVLLYGPPGTGKDTIAKMIASEWNRNIYYVTGGKGGKFIPNAIVDDSEDVNYPLILVSDIDKYPFLINEADVKLDENAKEEAMGYKQSFGAMINALDGVLSAEDRIIVMTTNHIEKFSDTFMRPGRIDLKMEIGYMTPETFRQYTWDYYHVELPEKFQLRDKKLTVATLIVDVVFAKTPVEEFIAKYTDVKA